MNIKYAVGLLGTVLALAGCNQQSLNPFHSAETLVDLPGITGAWTDGDDYALSLIRKDTGVYQLLAVDPKVGSLAEIDVHLFKIGDVHYFDFSSDDIDPDPPNDYFQLSLLGVHAIARVDQLEDELALTFLSSKRVGELLESGELTVPAHRMSDGRFVLTASTAELQAFVASVAEDSEAFDRGDSTIWSRLDPDQ